ncbi:hypothetical protein LPN04_21630 [Rugamonas sp. A1-17]|nr:hypothetical protein [Rugamonas sp. A1-17]
MKKQGKLSYSDFANIWRSILLLIVSQMIVEKSKNIYHSFTGKFSKIEKSVRNWNANALNPEVESAFEVLVSDELSIKLKNDKVGEVGGGQKNQETEKVSVIKHHLLQTESLLKEAIDELKLGNSHVLFIDGIDFRPEGVPYLDYIECIKGLAEAAWQLNTDFFGNIKDSKGRLKIILLVRPDVFQRLNLYNSNSRLHDNSVLLNWSTTEREFENSQLFEVSGRFFSHQQHSKHISEKDAWNTCFNGETQASQLFRKLLKMSFQKPRDILTFIKFARQHHIDGKRGGQAAFDPTLLSTPRFTKEYSEYLLGEVKNYASFYMSSTDFAIYLKMFQYLDGKSKFTMLQFEAAFEKFSKWVAGEEVRNREYLRDAESLLQFLYVVNIIGFHETATRDNQDFYHWAYRERTINNFSPKVKTSGELILNPGIAKALDIGKEKIANGNTAPQKPRAAAPKKKNRWVLEGRKRTAKRALLRQRELPGIRNNGC